MMQKLMDLRLRSAFTEWCHWKIWTHCMLLVILFLFFLSVYQRVDISLFFHIQEKCATSSRELYIVLRCNIQTLLNKERCVNCHSIIVLHCTLNQAKLNIIIFMFNSTDCWNRWLTMMFFQHFQREQMLEAQEMFRTSNIVTRPEKALILGFMAGSRGEKKEVFFNFGGVWCHFQQYFSYIMAVSFIYGGN